MTNATIAMIDDSSLIMAQGDTGTVEVTIGEEMRRVPCFARSVLGSINITVGSAVGASPIIGGLAGMNAEHPVCLELYNGSEIAWFDLRRDDRPRKLADIALRWAR